MDRWEITRTLGQLIAELAGGAPLVDVRAKLGRLIDDIPLLEAPKPDDQRRETKRKVDQAAVVERIIEHWRRVMEKPRAKSTSERVRVVRARLRDGYTEAELKLAVDGCSQSPHHMGANDRGTPYNDLMLICRNGSFVEKFRDMAGGAPKTSHEARREHIAAKAQAALKKGNTDEYERLNAQLRDLG